MLDEPAGHGPYEEFRALASRWDLVGLHNELAVILEAAPADQRPAVPSRLLHALHWFLESYGAEPSNYETCTSMLCQPSAPSGTTGIGTPD